MLAAPPSLAATKFSNTLRRENGTARRIQLRIFCNEGQNMRRQQRDRDSPMMAPYLLRRYASSCQFVNGGRLKGRTRWKRWTWCTCCNVLVLNTPFIFV